MFTKVQNILTIAVSVLVLGLGAVIGCKENKINTLTTDLSDKSQKLSISETLVAQKRVEVDVLKQEKNTLIDAKREDSVFYKKQEMSLQTLLKEVNDKNRKLKADVDSLLTGRFCKNLFGKIVKCK